MGGTMSRNKGQRAERQVIAILQPVVIEVYSALGCPTEQIPKLQRNTLQSDRGGYDVVGLEWIAIEVKHQERVLLADWWAQTVRQTCPGQEPVLFYKCNNVRFRVMMLGQIAIAKTENAVGRRRKIRTAVDVPLEVFLIYFRERLYSELGVRR